MKETQALDALGALSQETRLRIVRYLVTCGPDGSSVGQIGSAVEAVSSRLSFHLSALENSGLVTSERISRNIIYRADYEKIGGLIQFLLQDCCGNNPEVLACCAVKRDCC